MSTEIIIGKIKKLLKLAESPNEHEASSAIAKAHAMMEEHQLTAMHLGAQKEDEGSIFTVNDGTFLHGSKIDKWKVQAFKTLGDFYGVNPYINVLNTREGRTECLCAIGLESDLDLFGTTFFYVIKAVDSLRKKAWEIEKHNWNRVNRPKVVHKFRKDFSVGCIFRIAERLKAQRDYVGSGKMELVVMKKDLIKDFQDKNGMHMHGTHNPVKKVVEKFMDIGARAGDRVKLNQSLT